MFIFFQYTLLNEQLILRRKICARKKSYNFFKIQLFKESIVTQIEVTWRINYKIFLPPEDVWSANVERCWCTVRRSPKLSYATLWSRDHKRFLCQIENIILPVLQGLWPPNLAGVMTWGDRKPPLESHGHLTVHCCKVTWKIFNVRSLLQGTWSPTWEAGDWRWRGSTHKTTWPLN